MTTCTDDVEDEVPKKASLGERRGSRFDLSKDDGQTGDDDKSASLYRPEFGEPVDG